MVSAVDAGSVHRDEAANYTSIMPLLDDLLDLLGEKATAVEVGVDSNEAIVEKAKRLQVTMEEMKQMALDLPGGHVSLEKAKALEKMLDSEAEKRRATLEAFGEAKMDTIDRLGRTAESGMLTPAVVEKDE